VQQMQMQAQLDAQSQQQAAQLEQQKAQADIQAKQAELAIDAQSQQQKTAAEIEAMRIKNEFTLELERQKAEIAAWLEIQKANIAAQCKERESQAKCDEMSTAHGIEMEKAEAEGETKGVSIKGGPIARAVADLGKHLSGSQEQTIQAIIEAVKSNAPPPPRGMRVVRDANGRVSHTEPVE
jgi:hypothetical protein